MSRAYLAHHGIKGQKWGVRRYQNEDGSLTPEGKERYGTLYELARAKHSWAVYKKASDEDKAEANKLKKDMDAVYEADRRDTNAKEAKAILGRAKTKQEFVDEIIASKVEMEKRRGQTYSKKELERMAEYNGKWYDDLVSESQQGYKNEARKRITNEFKQETAKLKDNLSQAKYGSDEWFERREQYYKASDSYSKKYVDAILEDYNFNFQSDFGETFVKQYFGTASLLKGYAASDYRSIADPISGDRDYDLASKYEDWKKRTQR